MDFGWIFSKTKLGCKSKGCKSGSFPSFFLILNHLFVFICFYLFLFVVFCVFLFWVVFICFYMFLFVFICFFLFFFVFVSIILEPPTLEKISATKTCFFFQTAVDNVSNTSSSSCLGLCSTCRTGNGQFSMFDLHSALPKSKRCPHQVKCCPHQIAHITSSVVHIKSNVVHIKSCTSRQVLSTSNQMLSTSNQSNQVLSTSNQMLSTSNQSNQVLPVVNFLNQVSCTFPQLSSS